MFSVSQKRKQRRREVKPSPTPSRRESGNPGPAALTMTSFRAPDHSGVLGEFWAPKIHPDALP